MNKYHAKKIKTPDGTFDSKAEYERWLDLKVLEIAGVISNLRRQVPFQLIPEAREPDTVGARGGVKKGKLIEQKCDYIADFVYEQNGETVVEDCKGFKTPEYKIKRKLMLWVHHIKIKETK